MFKVFTKVKVIKSFNGFKFKVIYFEIPMKRMYKINF